MATWLIHNEALVSPAYEGLERPFKDQAPMQMGEIEKSDFLTLNRKVDKLLLEIDRSAEESNRKFNEQQNWIRTMREEMIKDADSWNQNLRN